MKNLLIIWLLFSNVFAYTQGKLKKDTLLIKYDKKLLSKEFNPVDNYHYYRIKGTGKSGFISLVIENQFQKISKLKVKKLKKVLKDSNSYNKSGKLDDWLLESYLSGYTVFIVHKKDTFIKVKSVFEIE